jgi:hypothetical protein
MFSNNKRVLDNYRKLVLDSTYESIQKYIDKNNLEKFILIHEQNDNKNNIVNDTDNDTDNDDDNNANKKITIKKIYRVIFFSFFIGYIVGKLNNGFLFLHLWTFNK